MFRALTDLDAPSYAQLADRGTGTKSQNRKKSLLIRSLSLKSSIQAIIWALLSPRFARMLSTPDGPLRGERMEQARPRERACGAQRNF